MSTAARDIRVSVVAETSRYREEIAKTGAYTAKQLNQATRQFAAETLKATAKVAAEHKSSAKEAQRAWSDVGDTIKGALGFQALKAAATGIYQYVDALHAARAETIGLSQATGIGLETLGAFRAAAGQAGASFDEIQGGIEDFGERMFDFAMGGGEAKEAFEQLGIKVLDANGNLRQTDVVLREVIAGMQATKNEAQKNAYAQQLFSDAGNRLNAVLGDAPLEDWIKYAKQTGQVITNDAVKATQEWTRVTNELSEVIRKSFDDLASATDATSKIERFTLGLTFAVAALGEAFNVASERVARFADIGAKLAAGDLFGANASWWKGMTTFDDDLQRVVNAGTEAAYALFEARDAIEGAGTVAESAGKKVGKLGGGLRSAAQDAATINRAMDELQKIVIDASASVITEEQQVGLAYQERLEAIDQIIAETKRAGVTADQMATVELGAQEAATAALLEYQVALAALTEQVATEAKPTLLDTWREAFNAVGGPGGYLEAIRMVADATQTLTQIIIDGHARRASSHRRTLDAMRAEEDRLTARMSENLTASEREYAEMSLRRIEAVAARSEEELRIQQRGALRAFRAQQALAQAVVLTQSPAALMQMFAQLGTPPAPGGYVAIASVAAATAAQSAAIWAQPPPQFDAGFPGFTQGPTNYAAVLDEGEGVANRRGMSALGGPEGMDELNRTGRLPMAQGHQEVALHVDSREMGRWMASEVRRGRELTQSLQKKGHRPGVAPKAYR